MKTKKNGFTLIELMVVIVIVGRVALTLVSLFGCTQQVRTKVYGGSMTIKLDPGIKLENCTWKDAQLWILTTKRNDGEIAHNHKFTEKSSFGVLEGEVIIEEQ